MDEKIHKEDMFDDGLMKAPFELVEGLEKVIVVLEKIRRKALDSGDALHDAQNPSDIQKLVTNLQREQEELRKVNQELQEQIKLLGKQRQSTASAGREAKQFQKGIIDMLKEVRIGGVSVGQVLDKLEKANSRVFSSITQGYTKASISAKLFGNAARTALTLTGIGVVIALLATLVAYWDDITEAIGLTKSASEKYFEAEQKRLDARALTLDNDLRLLKLQGKTEREIHLERIKRFNEQLLMDIKRLDAIEQLNKEQAATNYALRAFSFGLLGNAKDTTELTDKINKQREALRGLLIDLKEVEKKEGDDAADAAGKAKKAKDAKIKADKDAFFELLDNLDKELKANQTFVEKSLEQEEHKADEKVRINKEATIELLDELDKQIKAAQEATEKDLEFQEEAGKKAIAQRLANALDALQVTQDVFNTIDSALSQSSQRRLDELQAEEDALSRHYERLIAAAGDNIARRSELENDFADKHAKIEMKRRAEMRKSAQAEKANAMFSIIINTAKAIMSFLASVPPNPILAAAAGVMGAAQLVIVASQPIPSYAKGTDNHKGGLAKVGEEGEELLVNPRTGRVSLTPGRPTVMDLPAQTAVIPHQETMQMLAYAGLNEYTGGQRNTSDLATYFLMLRSDVRELNYTMRNKREIHNNWTRKGLEQAFKYGATREYFMNVIYR